MSDSFKQVVMLVLDGFGVASASEGNAVSAAEPGTINFLVNHYPSITLQASGPSVGLPWGERGNSEVGHLNLGAGRIVSEDLPRISKAIATEEFFKNPKLLGAMEHAKKNRSRLHIAGLVSEGGVHSSEEHLYALLALAADQGIKNTFVHMFTDGRDTAPKAAIGALERLTKQFARLGIGKVASVTGRFYAMDRGRHWELTEKTYQALTAGQGEQSPSVRETIERNYRREITDETIPPTIIMENSSPVATVASGDAVIFFNFRSDRMVQLATAFTDEARREFRSTHPRLENMYYATMTRYERNLPAHAAFEPQQIINGLSETLSKNNLKQFHIAESEKYAHVTSFFNGGVEEPFPGEERDIVRSPASYEKRYENVPEMSAGKVAGAVREKLLAGTDFILANFANCDMVGHTGNREASVAAVKAVDAAINVIFEAVAKRRGAVLLITADHGNIEEVVNRKTGQIEKEHSLNPVPFIAAAKGFGLRVPRKKGYLELAGRVPEGVLSDVSPTVLELLGITKPPEMKAISLLPLFLKQV